MTTEGANETGPGLRPVNELDGRPPMWLASMVQVGVESLDGDGGMVSNSRTQKKWI